MGPVVNAAGDIRDGDFMSIVTRKRRQVIERRDHHEGSKGRCSGCHGKCPSGVVFRGPKRDFDPRRDLHVMLCGQCVRSAYAAWCGKPNGPKSSG